MRHFYTIIILLYLSLFVQANEVQPWTTTLLNLLTSKEKVVQVEDNKQEISTNSLKLKERDMTNSYAYFAGGCFWGVEYYLERLNGVYSVTSGYMGGDLPNPNYSQVSSGDRGHLESVEVEYNSSIISYEKLAKVFFEIHDPTQKDGQGADIGEQYLSAVFVSNTQERSTIEGLIALLEERGYSIATKILKKSSFYIAKESHQDYYYKRKDKKPYCHGYIKRF